MSVIIRLGNVKGRRVKDLAGLTDDHMKILKDDYQILLLSDLALLNKADTNDTIGNDKDTFLKRRTLFAIMDFLRKEGRLDSTITMQEIMAWDGNRGSTNTTSKSTALIKLSPSDFPKFSGALEDQEEFQAKAEAHI
eukprot:14432512-Ditylum_brightwellii.AAC.1